MGIFDTLAGKIADLPGKYVEIHRIALAACGEALDLQQELRDAQKKNGLLEDEVAELRRKADRAKEFFRSTSGYFRMAADGTGLEPLLYCKVCLENDDAISQMVQTTQGDFWCPICASKSIQSARPLLDVANQELASLAARLAKQGAF